METVTVFGGSGFIGRHVVRALARSGYRVRAAVRRPDLAGHLQPLGGVGQIQTVQANVRFSQSVSDAVEGADAVINLVGILHETRRQGFDDVHVRGARAVAQAALDAGLERIVHFSALGADRQAAAHYARSKAGGEHAVFELLPDSTICRPSIVFGPEDGFFNRFAELARFSPVLPLIGGGETRFQPVFVDDLANAAVMAVRGQTRPGAIYELGGPRIWTFRELLMFILDTIARKRILVPVPFQLARLKARFLQLLPNPLLTVDQVLMLESDNIVSASAKARKTTLQGLGVAQHTVEAIVPSYLEAYRPAGQFSRDIGTS